MTTLAGDANVTPRWEKQKREKKCCVDMCDNTCYSVSSVGTREQIACILKCELVPYPTPLCHQHYNYVYDTLQSKATRCCTCNATLRNARKRVCPDSETIQKYLMQTEINTDVSTSSSTQSIGLASPNAMLDDINSRLHQVNLLLITAGWW